MDLVHRRCCAASRHVGKHGVLLERVSGAAIRRRRGPAHHSLGG